MPIMVVVGTAGDSEGRRDFRDVIAGKTISGSGSGELSAHCNRFSKPREHYERWTKSEKPTSR